MLFYQAQMKFLIYINPLKLIFNIFQDADSQTITISANGIIGIVLGVVSLISIFLGAWFSKLIPFGRNRVDHENPYELQGLNEYSSSDNSNPFRLEGKL